MAAILAFPSAEPIAHPDVRLDAFMTTWMAVMRMAVLGCGLCLRMFGWL